MFDWLKRKKVGDEMPHYTALLRQPSRELPAALVEAEKSEAYKSQHDAIESSLLEGIKRPVADRPLFIELLSSEENGFLTLPLREGKSCLLVFSSPFRAADYVRTIGEPRQSVKFLSSSPLDLTRLLSDVRGVGIEKFTLDRCPRCNFANAVSSESISTPDRAIEYWSIIKAIELARTDLYLEYARECAVGGDFETAREVTLETVGHVSFEDPRAHYLLGQLGVALQDWMLIQEAKDLLKFLKFDSWEEKLDAIIRTRTPDFSLYGNDSVM